MNYGLALPNAGPDARTLVELAVQAEQAGWDGIFLEDYIVWQGHQEVPTYDPWALLSAMALVTQRVRLGTQVTALARRRPWVVAKQAATLDHLSQGRAILGVGLGDNLTGDPSFSAFGEQGDLRRRAVMLDEALEIIAGLWRGEPFHFEGSVYQVQEATLLPRPLQQPHPGVSPRVPIWVGGAYPLKGPLQRAARWDGACMYRHKTHFMTAEDVRNLRSFVLERRGTLGGYDVAVGGSRRRDDWEEERAYIQSLAEAGATWWIEYADPDLGLPGMRQVVSREPLRVAP